MGAPIMYDTRNSPFLELQSPLTVWEMVKMALLIWTVPLRVTIFLWAAITVAVLNSLAVYGCDLDKPLPRWRRRAVEISSQSMCAVMLRCMGFWWPRVTGLEHLEKAKEIGALGIMNHVAWLDAWTIVWAFCASGVTFHFSKELPILGPGIRALQNLYLPKEDDKSKQQASMVQLIRDRVADTRMPMLFVAPEGTLGDGRCLLQFKTGAFVAGTPVVPILLRYRLTPCNPAWTIIKEWWHALRLMCQFSNGLVVEVLPPYFPSAEEKANPALYAANIRNLMAQKLGVKLVDQDRSYYLALVKAKVGVSWDGRRVVAPPGRVDEAGFIDLGPYMPSAKAAK